MIIPLLTSSKKMLLPPLYRRGLEKTYALRKKRRVKKNDDKDGTRTRATFVIRNHLAEKESFESLESNAITNSATLSLI